MANPSTSAEGLVEGGQVGETYPDPTLLPSLLTFWGIQEGRSQTVMHCNHCKCEPVAQGPDYDNVTAGLVGCLVLRVLPVL